MTSAGNSRRLRVLRLALLLLVALFIVAAGAASQAGHRIQDEAEGEAESVKLERTPLAPKKAGGSLDFNIGATDEDISRIRYKGSVHSLNRGRVIYRIWLWDGLEDVKIPLRRFRVDQDGSARISGTRRILNIERFDQVVVTRQRTTGPEKEREPRIVLVGEVALLAN